MRNGTHVRDATEGYESSKLFKINRMRTVPIFVSDIGTLVSLMSDQKNVSKYKQMTNRFNEWCREGELNPHGVASDGF